MGVKILIDGPGADEMDRTIRAALGHRPADESWVLSLVKHKPMWTVSVLVSPQDRLWGWTYFGPREYIPEALSEAVCEAGLEVAFSPTRAIR